MRTVLALVALSATGLPGCVSEPYHPLVELVDAAPVYCEHGGWMVRRGSDDDRNGRLSDHELLDQRILCQGAPGEVVQSPDPVISRAVPASESDCPLGGVVLQEGGDANDNGRLDEAEVTDTEILCFDDAPSLGLGVERLTGDVVVRSALDLVQLTGVEAVEGHLAITCEGRSLPDLSPLASLHEVSSLTLEGCHDLVTLEGLEGLERVRGDLVLTDLPHLEDLQGLEGLTRVEGTLSLADLPQLFDLQGLDGLEEAGGLALGTPHDPQGLGSLHHLTGLESLHTVGPVTLTDLPVLQDVEALAAVETATSLTLVRLDALTELSSLQGVGPVLDHLTLQDLPVLASLAGLQGLERVDGDVSLDLLPMVSTLEGLHGLGVVEGDLALYGLLNLVDTSDLQALGTVDGDLVLTDLPTLTSLTLPALHTVGDDLALGHPEHSVLGNPMLTSLSGLAPLEMVGGTVRIAHQRSLASLHGLHGLQAVDEVFLVANDDLTDLSALHGLGDVASQQITVIDHPCLDDVDHAALEDALGLPVAWDGNGGGIACE